MQTIKHMLQNPKAQVAVTLAASATLTTATAYFAGMNVSATAPAAALSMGIAAISNPAISAPLFGIITACCIVGVGIYIIDNFLSEQPIHEILAQRDIKQRKEKCQKLKKQIQDEIAKYPTPVASPYIQQQLDALKKQLDLVNKHLEQLNKRTAKNFLSLEDKESIDTQLNKIEEEMKTIKQRPVPAPRHQRPAAPPAYQPLMRQNSAP